MSLHSQLGITRVARVTGLDRCGVEVACAVRPLGHVLQVTNGKAATFEEASFGAVMEAAELWAAERVDTASLRLGTVEELSGSVVLDPVSIGGAGLPLRMTWAPARMLKDDAPCWVPAHAVYCPPAGSAFLGPATVSWCSNGMGAHPELHRALLHALLEAAERDQLARALPDGWTFDPIRKRRLGVLPGTTATLVSTLAERGFDAFLFDLTPETRVTGALGLPVAGAFLFDRERGPVPLTAGYACGLDPESALLGALREAAQSRLTDIHGAREDISARPEGEVQAAHQACVSKLSRTPRSWKQMPRVKSASPRLAVKHVTRLFHRAGFTQVAWKDLSPRGLGVHVVKVLGAGLLLSELL